MLIITKVTWRCTHAHFKNNHMKLELEMEIFAVATPPKTRSTLSPYYLGHKELMRAIEGQIGVRFKNVEVLKKRKNFRNL